LKQRITIKQRKELEARMAKVFHKNVKGLSAELQRILLDDLVTAFQNRINVLIRAQAKSNY
jgi:phosphotransferase system HPr-like phosphotransfer protein